MSNPQGAKGPTDKRSGGSNGRGGPRKKFYQKKAQFMNKKFEEKTFESLSDVPVLRYGQRCNLYEFREAIESFARTKCAGELARLFIDDAYYVPPNIEVGEDLSEDEVEQLGKEREMRLKDIYKMNSDKPKLAQAMWSRLSDESKEKLRERPEYDAVLKYKSDPLAMWLAIKATHTTLGARNAAVNQEYAEEQYRSLKMQPYETLAGFKDRFQHALDALRNVNATVPSNSMQAVQFLKKLDDRYTKLKELLAQLDSLGNANAYPATLADAYVTASRFVVSVDGRGNPMGKKRFLSGSGEAVFLACEDVGKKGGKRKGDKKKPNKKNGRDKSNVKCYKCGNSGHYANECEEENNGDDEKNDSNKKDRRNRESKVMFTKSATPHGYIQDDDDDDDEMNLVVIEAERDDDEAVVDADSSFDSGHELFVARARKAEPDEDYTVLLDNQATKSLIRNENLCTNVRHTGEFHKFTGVGGTVSTDLVGDMPYFGTVCILSAAPANILALNEVEDKFEVSYVPGSCFRVKVHPSLRYEFMRTRKGLYACDMEDIVYDVMRKRQHEAYVQTVEDNEKLYTKDQVERAKVARRVMIELGCTSAANLIKLARGIMMNLPVSAEDVYRATKIYGPLLGAVKGKTKIRKAGKVIVEHVPRPVESVLTMYSDLMFIAKIPFLISVVLPMGLVLGNWLESRSEKHLLAAFNGQLRQLRGRFFEVARILVDGEGGIYAIRELLAQAGIVLEPVGRNQHIPEVEIRNKVVKQIFRSVITSLPYKLPKFLFKYLVFFALSRINLYPVSSRADPTPARELFTGRKIDYKRDVRIGFGEYVQIDAYPNPRNDATKPRTKGALSLDPRGNLQGSVRFFVLGSEKKKVTIVTRDTWVKMVMTPEVVEYVNEVAKDCEENPGQQQVEEVNDVPPGDQVDGAVNVPEVVEEEAKEAVEEAAADAGIVEPPRQLTTDYHVPVENVPDVLDMAGVDEDVEDVGVGGTVPTDEFVRDLEEKPPPGEDIVDVLLHCVKFNHEVFTQMSYKKGLKKHGTRAMNAAEKELRQMCDQDVWDAIMLSSLPIDKRKKVIRSFMFLKEKFKPDGSFDKLKMRLVAGGHMQEKLDMEIVSSPTVSLSAVFIVFAFAVKLGMTVVTVDITGAYLNAYMGASEVFMRIDPELADVLERIDTKYKSFRNGDGSIVVKLKKALYGCIESAKLWYELLSSKLVQFGLKKSAYDECVFSNIVNGELQLIVAVYVDDLLIAGRSKVLVDDLVKFLEMEFKTITLNVGVRQAYLGMNFCIDYASGRVEVSMEKYIDDVIAMSEGLQGSAKTPATSDLFVVDETSALVSEKEKKKFHSMVAKLLYLAKRTRPDILTVISFLATRVKCTTEQDLEKLNRLLRYIRATREFGLSISASNDHLVAYVDASHAVHTASGKSQTGLYVTVGSGPVFVRSSKQKLVAKSSTEAELIAISDSLPQLLWIREFMLEQKLISEGVPVMIMEDNQSTIALIKKGRATGESSRHINVRNFFVSDRQNMKEVKVVFVRTEDQVADFFTKALQGGLFKKFRGVVVVALQEKGKRII